jgi:hypothetical protein
MENLPKNLWLGGAIALLVLGASCVRASFEAAADAAADAQDPGGTGGAGDAGEAGPGAEVRMTCPAPNLACSGGITTGTCDPVCQTGNCDWCNHNQKCTYAFDGTVAQAVCAKSGQGVFPQACQVTSSGSLQQSDDCATGSICLAPTIGDAFTYCFGLCRSKAECLYGAECGPRKLSPAGGSVSVCDPPYDQCGVDGKCCDPLAGSGCDANRFCLLVSPDLQTAHSRTVCDFAYGDGRNSSSCSLSRDCLLKNTCVNNICRQVCNDTNPCPNKGTCTPLGTEYGYCPN